MATKRSVFARRAWNFLRLALLWARKGGVFKRRLITDLRLLPRYLKNLRHHTPRNSIHYREREFSFDETPLFHFKMRRPASMRFHIPCLNPQVDFDFDFDGNDEDACCKEEGRRSFLRGDDKEQCCESEYGGDENGEFEMVRCEEEEIDAKAEQFIANFYEQMKLQRQISYLQYNEMLNRGTS